MRPETIYTVERLRAIADDECIHDHADVETVRWAADEIVRLRAAICVAERTTDESFGVRLMREGIEDNERRHDGRDRVSPSSGPASAGLDGGGAPNGS